MKPPRKVEKRKVTQHVCILATFDDESDAQGLSQRVRGEFGFDAWVYKVPGPDGEYTSFEVHIHEVPGLDIVASYAQGYRDAIQH